MVMVSLKTGLWFIHGNIQDILVWIVVIYFRQVEISDVWEKEVQISG